MLPNAPIRVVRLSLRPADFCGTSKHSHAGRETGTVGETDKYIKWSRRCVRAVRVLRCAVCVTGEGGTTVHRGSTMSLKG